MMQPHNQSLKHAFIIAFIYFIPGILWIYFSDNLVSSIALNNTQLALLQLYKGWFFIGFTTFLLFLVSYRFLKQQFQTYERYLNEQKNLQIALDKQYSLLKSIVDSSPDAIFAKDSEGRYLLFNEGASKIINIPAENVLGKTDTLIFSHETAQKLYEADHLIIQNKKIQNHQEILKTAAGEEKIFWETKGPLYTPEGDIFGIFGISRDITEQSHYEQKLLEEKEKFDLLAHHDPLTSLPNRLSLIETLNRIIGDTTIPSFTLLFLDLDGFQHINDSYGHQFGDKLLIKVSELLQHIFLPDAYVVRTGGDEFVIILYHQLAPDTLENLLESLNHPFHIEGIDLYITTSIGVAKYPENAQTTENLLQCVDAAMYKAKRMGKNTFWFYSTELIENALQRTTITNNLKKALDNGDLQLHYQPQVDPKTNKIIGYEALLRWQTSEGFISPGTFIPICEESGLIHEIGEFVLLEGCKTALKWSQLGILHGHIAINVSARQLIHPDFIFMLERIIQQTGCQPYTIELEITESSILENPEKVTTLLASLKSKGFMISIDDFGTGYSSLSYLKNLPVDKLKIDISFIRNITQEPKNKTIVQTIIALAKGLGMTALAEGVETEEELAFLRENDIDSIQGFYYYKPMSCDAIEHSFTI